MENSSARLMYMVVSRMTREMARLVMNMKSKSQVGRGTMIRKMTPTTMAEMTLLNSFIYTSFNPFLFRLYTKASTSATGW